MQVLQLVEFTRQSTATHILWPVLLWSCKQCATTRQVHHWRRTNRARALAADAAVPLSPSPRSVEAPAPGPAADARAAPAPQRFASPSKCSSPLGCLSEVPDQTAPLVQAQLGLHRRACPLPRGAGSPCKRTNRRHSGGHGGANAAVTAPSLPPSPTFSAGHLQQLPEV